MGKLGSTDTGWCCFNAWFNFPDWIRVFSEFGNLGRAWLWLNKINSSTIGTMQRTAITVNYLQMLCHLVVLFFFLRRVALVVGVLFFFRRGALVAGVLLSLKSCFIWWGACLLAFFELLCMLCCLLSASSKVCFTCGVAWLVERWSFVSCFFSFYK